PPVASGGRLEARDLGVVRVADRFAEPRVQLAAVEDDLLRVHGRHGVHRHRELARVLDVHDEAVRLNVAHRSELVTAVRHERLVPDLDRLWHARQRSNPPAAGAPTTSWAAPGSRLHILRSPAENCSGQWRLRTAPTRAL